MVKRTFSLPEELLRDLDGVPNKSLLVRDALRKELERLRRLALQERLREAYRKFRIGKKTDQDWDRATIESWPEE